MKGVLFTACLTILALVVLTASFLFHQQGLEEQGSMARLALFDRMADEYTAAEKGLREVVNCFIVTGINITIEGFMVSISEPLPNPNTFEFEGNASGWKEFVENTSDFSLNVNISDITRTLSIHINGAEYYHHPKFGGYNIRMRNASDVEDYGIGLQVDGDIDVGAWYPFEAGTNIFNLSIINSTDSYWGSWDLDFERSSELNITIGGTNVISIAIGLPSDHGRLKIDNKDNLSMNVTTNITFDKEPSINFFKKSINITESQYNISRISSVRII